MGTGPLLGILGDAGEYRPTTGDAGRHKPANGGRWRTLMDAWGNQPAPGGRWGILARYWGCWGTLEDTGPLLTLTGDSGERCWAHGIGRC